MSDVSSRDLVTAMASIREAIGDPQQKLALAEVIARVQVMAKTCRSPLICPECRERVMFSQIGSTTL
jgi:TPP-dependent indolepyruvate ferredoxin oxidoreductase alpha subunit